MIGQPQVKRELNNYALTNDNPDEEVKPVHQMKVLGFTITPRGSNDLHITKLVSQCHSIINNAFTIKRFFTKREKKFLMESQVLSRLRYSAPIIAAETIELKDKVLKMIHKAARFIQDNYYYKRSIKKLMTDVNWKMPKDVIDESSAKFGHSLITTGIPITLSLIKIRQCLFECMFKYMFECPSHCY